MQRILLPFDFSVQARRGLALALSGVPFGPDIELDVFHVVDDRLYERRLPAHEPPSAEALQSYFKDELARASTPERKVRKDPTLTVVHGKPAPEILTRLGRYSGVIIGGQGHGGVGETLLGTTAMRVVREAPVSVYVVKRTTSLAIPCRVMCAVESDDSSRQALREAVRFAKASNANLSLMRVLQMMPIYPEYPVVAPFATPEQSNDERDRLISFELDTLKESYAKRHVAVFSAGATASDICRQAAMDRVDAIVIGARADGVAKRLFGSISEGVVQRATCDVFVIR